MNKAVKGMLDKYEKIQPGFKVQRFIEFPCPWVPYNTAEFEEYLETYGDPNHREILMDEIVIDVDADDKEDGIIHSDRVQAILDKKEFKYMRYASGGDGQHFHLWFPELSWFFDDKYYTSRIKYMLIRYILGDDIIEPKDLKSHICMHNKTLIQIEFANHRKGGKKKIVTKNDGNNYIPPEFFDVMTKKVQEYQQISEHIKNNPEQDNLPCIRFFRGETVQGLNYFKVKDGLYRTMFALVGFWKRQYPNDLDKVTKLTMEWYNSIPTDWRNKSKRTVNEKIINYTVKNNRGSVGCLYRMEILEDIHCDKVCTDCPHKAIVNTVK